MIQSQSWRARLQSALYGLMQAIQPLDNLPCLQVGCVAAIVLSREASALAPCVSDFFEGLTASMAVFTRCLPGRNVFCTYIGLALLCDVATPTAMLFLLTPRYLSVALCAAGMDASNEPSGHGCTAETAVLGPGAVHHGFSSYDALQAEQVRAVLREVSWS